jgi:plastocyanin
MKRMFGILALMVVASIMIAGCVQPTGNETIPGATPAATTTPMATGTLEAETPQFVTAGPTETPMTTPVDTGTPMATATTMTPAETETTAANGATPATTTAAGATPIITVVEGTPAAGAAGDTPATTAATATETPPAPPITEVADETISIAQGGFVPNTITVPPGTTVGWTNDGNMNQTVTGTGDMSFFDSGLLQPGDTFLYTFTATGNYTYMSQTTGAGGEVIVTPSTT